MTQRSYDLLIVGAGILGLAHAYHAARAGLSVAVLDRDTKANGASLRNFGFVTVTGQQRGAFHQMCQRTRDTWAEIAPQAGIDIHHQGLIVAAQRLEAMAVLESLMDTEMGEGCELMGAEALKARYPDLLSEPMSGGLWSPHEVRVDSRSAIPRLTQWLAECHEVDFHWATSVHGVETGRVQTSQGDFTAQYIAVCPGDDRSTLFPEVFAQRKVTRCKLHMMRLANPGFKLPGAVMSDLSMVRYLGYAERPESQALKARLEQEQPDHLQHGVHLIVVQNGDGSLVVGDTHHYDDTPDPFAPSAYDDLVLAEYENVFGQPAPAVLERWTGTYASSAQQQYFIEPVAERVNMVVVTCGAGASSGFAIGEDSVERLLNPKSKPALKVLAE